MESSTRGLWLFRIVLFAGIIAGLVILLNVDFQPQLPDYIQYWTASRLNLQAGNPYDSAAMLSLQVKEGWQEPDPILMWNPPWIMPLLIPFGWLGFRLSQWIWLLIEIGLILVCGSLYWSFYGGEKHRIWLSWLIVLSFAPTLFSLIFAQLSPFLLLGLTIFLLLITRPREEFRGSGFPKALGASENPGSPILTRRVHGWKTDLLAGAGTWFLALKPQYLFLFWIVLFLWSVKNRRWFVLLGTGGALVLATALAMYFNPDVIGEYLAAITLQPPDYWATPTLGYWLRVAFGVEKFILQFLPAALGAICAVVYWFMRKGNWDWKQEMPWIVFGSIITSPYGWSFDQILLLPFLIQALVLVSRKKANWGTCFMAVSWLMLNAGNVALHFRFGDENFVWFTPMVLVFWWAIHTTQNNK